MDFRLISFGGKRQGLLAKWRGKCFELLVQLKSQELSLKQERQSELAAQNECHASLASHASRARVLELELENRQAELSVLSAANESLSERLSAAQQERDTLVQRGKQDLESSVELARFVDSLLKQYTQIEESFRLASRKLSHLDQRVEFAKNRLSVVRALYQSSGSSGNQLKKNILEMTTNLSSIHGSIIEQQQQQQQQSESIQQQTEKQQQVEKISKILKKFNL